MRRDGAERCARQLLDHVGARVGDKDVRRVVAFPRQQRRSWPLIFVIPLAYFVVNWLFASPRAMRSSALSFNAVVLTAFVPVQLAGICWYATEGPEVAALDLVGAGLAFAGAALVALALRLPIGWQLPADLRVNRVPVP